jgi:hypothetical protein
MKTKWTLKTCKDIAKSFTTKLDWINNSRLSYNAAARNGWLDLCYEHMGTTTRYPNGHWTKKNCILNAKKYNKITEWSDNGTGAHSIAKRNGWDKLCTKHMSKKHLWTKTKCIKEAKLYKRRCDWDYNSNGAKAARRHGWFEECAKHMPKGHKPDGYWTKENCLKDMKNYKTKREWFTKSNYAYKIACKNGWLKEFNKHLK